MAKYQENTEIITLISFAIQCKIKAYIILYIIKLYYKNFY